MLALVYRTAFLPQSESSSLICAEESLSNMTERSAIPSCWRLRLSSSNGRVPVYLLHAGHDTLKLSSIMLPPSLRAMLCATSQPDGRRQHTQSPHISHLPVKIVRNKRSLSDLKVRVTIIVRANASLPNLPPERCWNKKRTGIPCAVTASTSLF